MSQNRHGGAMALGAVTAPGNTVEVEVGGSFTKGVLHVYGVSTRVDMLCSPDGGTTWCTFLRPNGIRGRWTLTAGDFRRAFMLPIVPGLFRLFVDTADLSAAYIEPIREIG